MKHKQPCPNDHPRMLHTESIVIPETLPDSTIRHVAGAGYSSVRGVTILWAPVNQEGYCAAGAVVSEVLLACIQRLEQLNEICDRTMHNEDDLYYGSCIDYLRAAVSSLKNTPQYRSHQPVFNPGESDG